MLALDLLERGAAGRFQGILTPSSCANSSSGAHSGGVRSGQCSRPANKPSRLYPASSRNASFTSGTRSNSPEATLAMVDWMGPTRKAHNPAPMTESGPCPEGQHPRFVPVVSYHAEPGDDAPATRSLLSRTEFRRYSFDRIWSPNRAASHSLADQLLVLAVESEVNYDGGGRISTIGASSSEAAAEEHHHGGRYFSNRRIFGWFSSLLCQGKAYGERSATGWRAEPHGPAPRLGWLGLLRSQPEELWTRGRHRSPLFRTYPGGSRSD